MIYDQTKADTAATTPTDGGGGGDPAKPKSWKPMNLGDGFAMDTPNGDVNKSDAEVMFGTEGLNAKKYVKQDNDSTIQITAVHCDLSKEAARKFDHTAMVLEMFAMPSAGPTYRGPRFIGEREAREYTFDRAGAHDAMWIARVGDRAYGFQFHWANPAPAGVLETKEAFFRSLSINYSGGVEPFEPAPRNPGPTVPAPIEQPWVALTNSAGFKAEAPKGVQTEKLYADWKSKLYNGRKYTAEDAYCNYYAVYHDIPESADVDLHKILTAHHQFLFVVKSPDEGKLDGKVATKWTFQNGVPGYGYSVRVGFRVFTFIVGSKFGLPNKIDATHEARAEKFFKSIEIAFDPKKADLLADEPEWAAMAKAVGFSALAPKGTTVADHRVGFARDEIKGTEFKCEDEGILYQVFAYDLPAGKTIDKVVAEHLNRQPITQGPKAITIDGYAAEELTYQDFFKLPIAMRSVKVGNRAFVAKIAKRFGGGNVSDMEFDARKAKFFANFHVGAGGGAVVDPGPGDPKPAGTGEFVKGGKVLPFWTAVVLPETKELITCSIRDAGAAKPSGVLRRYGYPDFKLKATYQLPLPVNRMVADEKSGRL